LACRVFTYFNETLVDDDKTDELKATLLKGQTAHRNSYAQDEAADTRT
jgi:hypothetical protein